ncbi:DinB family protein [Virgibacillus senegalensis]|uniref:DinB family protein n=1 Tax=Virgibacillus senegalensis TaxID=1499679 RepID=UPI00069D63B9|nr:DinB family protein [Virgibacillus senegalensis]
MSKASELRDEWYRHRQVLQELLEKIDEQHIHFTPWEGAFTLGGLAVHIATSMEMFAGSVKEGALILSNNKHDFETMADVRQIVENCTQTTLKHFETITDEQLIQPLEMNGVEAPASVWLSNARDHEIHHKGQLFTYARIVGVKEMPFFIKQPPKR